MPLGISLGDHPYRNRRTELLKARFVCWPHPCLLASIGTKDPKHTHVKLRHAWAGATHDTRSNTAELKLTNGHDNMHACNRRDASITTAIPIIGHNHADMQVQDVMPRFCNP